MGAFQAKRKKNSRVQLPLLDTPDHIRSRLSLLASANDPVYRAAFGEYITDDDIHYFLKADLMSLQTSPNLTVFRGDVYLDRYMITKKIASRRYTSVWLAVDLNTYSVRNNPTCEYVVLKISREELHYSKGIRFEIELRSRIMQALEKARIPCGYSPVVRVLSHFKLAGLNGSHICLIMERMRCDLRALLDLNESRRLPLHTVRLIARDALKALDFLHHGCGLVHTDLKPANILIAVDESLLSSGRYHDPISDRTFDLEELRRPPPVVKIGDLGSATEIASPRVVTTIGTIHYRAPEVLLGMHYHTNYDCWSLACTIFEMLTGAKLFDPKRDPLSNLNESEALLAEVYKILGRLPENLRHLPQANIFFDEDGRFRHYPDLERDPWPIQRLLREIHGYDQQEAIEIEDFLRPMLDIDPAKRGQCRDRLWHPWMKSVMTGELLPKTVTPVEDALQEYGSNTSDDCTNGTGA